MLNTSLVWFRNDLRTTDNPALFEACERGPAVAVFLIAQEQWQLHHVAPRRLSFLKKSLLLLQQDLRALNIPLLVRPAPLFADAAATITTLAREWNAERVFCNAEYPLNEQRRDRDVFNACRDAGVGFERHHGGVIVPPGTLRTQAQKPYTVFTPFKRRWLETLTPDAWTPLPAPEPQQTISNYSASTDTPTLEAIASLPDHNIDAWPVGEAEAASRLSRFLDERVEDYQRLRDFPAREGTSRLSPYLSIGAVSARSCLAAARSRNGNRLNATPGQNKGLDTWVSELIWREFYRHVCADFPHISRGAAFKRETDKLHWRHDPQQFDRWREGMTGYPLVDAGMRQLKETGWMHNRVRMVTAMFLSKHLLLDWRLGERHFMETLIDGDFAANNGGWQWSASTGTDAAPYFRIFNPSSQEKKFDPTHAYIGHWVPELRDGSADNGYPEPLVDHAAARERALAFFKRG